MKKYRVILDRLDSAGVVVLERDLTIEQARKFLNNALRGFNQLEADQTFIQCSDNVRMGIVEDTKVCILTQEIYYKKVNGFLLQ